MMEGQNAVEELTIVLADEQAAVRAGLRGVLEPAGLRIVGEVQSAADAVATALQLLPDVVLLSASLPGGAIEAIRLIKSRTDSTHLVMLSGAGYNEELFGALRAGADGYLLMTTSPQRLPHAIRGVVRGEAALPRTLTTELIREFRDHGHRRRLTLPDHEPVELTAREYEVLERLRQSERTAEIARRLSISEVTVRRHISSILSKLGVPDRRSALTLLQRAETASTRPGSPPGW
jgi:DNA-binding NarL/FixJ family response regulator